MEKYNSRLIQQLKNLNEGNKGLIKFEEIALSFFQKNTNLNEFYSWKEKNKKTIVESFEALCKQYDVICQECNLGPWQGNYWISKKIN